MHASAAIIEGRIDTLRVAVPALRGNVHLRVDGVSVFGTLPDASVIHTLRTLQEQGPRVLVGVIDDAQGMRHFRWLVAPQGPRIAPDPYHDAWRRGSREIGIGMAVAAAACLAAWLLGVSSLARTLLMTLSLCVALVALLLSGFTAHGLWSNRRHRGALLHSEALYRQCAQTYPPTPATRPAPTLAFVPASPRQGKRHGR